MKKLTDREVEVMRQTYEQGYYYEGVKHGEEKYLWDVKALRPYIIDIEKSQTATLNTHHKIKAHCRKCGTEKEVFGWTLFQQGFACLCTKGAFYPERFFSAYLRVKGIENTTQVKVGNTRRRIDFKIQLNGKYYFVETHGLQHYQVVEGVWEDVHKLTVKSDNIKRQYAKDVGVELIELDCRQSSFTFIEKSINDNPILPNITDEERFEIWEMVEEKKGLNKQSRKENITKTINELIEIGVEKNMAKKLIIKGDVRELEFEEVLEIFTPYIHKEIRRQKSIYDRYDESEEDMFQDASIWLWKAYRNYNIKKGYHFTTHAVKYVRRGVQDMTRKNLKEMRNGITISMDEQIGDDNENDFTLSNVLSEEVDFDSSMVTKDVLKLAIDLMSSTEAEYLPYMLKGYSQQEVAEEKGITRQGVRDAFMRIRKKVKMAIDNYEQEEK